MTLKERCEHEWYRQNAIFEEAQRHGIESVMLSCLAAMNAIVKILGYAPKLP